MRRKSKLFLSLILFFSFPVSFVYSQATSTVNGVADERETIFAFTNATIVKDAENTINNGTLLIQKNKIIGVGNNIPIPNNAVVMDCAGKFLYPSFIDLYSNYGVPTPQRATSGGFNPFQQSQLTTANMGAYSWNQAIKPEVNASALFTVVDKDAEVWRSSGFGTVLTHQRDGIARGSGTVVTLAHGPANFVMLKPIASAHYSFSKGTSTQSYPSSLMGMIALLRQTYLDADWYKSLPADKPGEGTNLSLQAWNDLQGLPQIFEANDKWNDLRASRIADEFGKKYIIKGGGNEYQRIKEIAGIRSTFILPLTFPASPSVSDPIDARNVTLATLKNWEMAPGNMAAFEKENIPFCITADGLRDGKTFFANLKKAIDAGLTEKTALAALTSTPAQTIGIYDMVGSLETGKLANFIITNKPIFDEGTTILQNWIQGTNYDLHPESWKITAGTFQLVLTDNNGKKTNYNLHVKSASAADVIGTDTLAAKFTNNGSLVQISFSPVKQKAGPGRNANATPAPNIILSGKSTGKVWEGAGVDTSGNHLLWVATLTQESPVKSAPSRTRKEQITSEVNYPFGAYGWTTKPEQKDVLFKNATVWTSEKAGVLKNTDVLVKNGKIAAIGKNLNSAGATVIDATGMHLTPGIIDEHSHIAVQSINEGGQSVTSEVRIGDNLNPEDINIYRQLSGGVTTSQILHGSANAIGGQSQLIKLRWGVNDTDLKFAGADPFIKFALGENVKRTTSQNNNRFPNTRMGVEEVLMDAFTRARDYENQWKAWNSRPKGSTMLPVRRDLELDALVEILNSKRFITSHSYVQSEIIAAMRVAEKFGFRYNTFTHILEGYKVADKLKKHGANASTFSDWWNYKMEVVDAIPQNAAIMTRMGLNTAINSDDAEMARRLNQEAAKSIKYGLSEEEALKMVTINPATMLHVQDKVGSIKVGKDADLVLWNHNPLTIYAVAQKTMVDGIIYFDRERDLQLREQMKAEKNRLIQKANSAGRGSGAPGMQAGGFTPPFSYLGVGDDYIDQYMQP